jgi:hypothetical protein
MCFSTWVVNLNGKNIPKNSKKQIPNSKIYRLNKIVLFYSIKMEIGISTIGISYIFSTFDKI